jgi:UDP-glucuronate 4-epimerase
MKILITGVAGFIGFSIAKNFLNKKYTVYGIDNFDNYYSVKLKKLRIENLKKNKKFFFFKFDLTNKKKLAFFLKKKNFDYVFHMAAQAGVRYSYINPNKYTNTNILMFINLLNLLKSNIPKNIFYASSSSVYGNNINFPLSEEQNLRPINIYGVSKKLNEVTADFFRRIHKMNIVGLRFFTVYGEWGRPDMFLMKLFKCKFDNLTFYLNNKGNHQRDFTYIGDVIKVLNNIFKKKLFNVKVLNICSGKPINIKEIIKKNNILNNIKINYVSKNKADVLKTHGSNFKAKKLSRIKKFLNFNDGLKKTYNWYKEFNINNIT